MPAVDLGSPVLRKPPHIEVTEEMIQGITKRIVDNFHPHRVILFGSYAYGNPHDDSDIDIFVEMDSNLEWHPRCIQVKKVARVPGVAMDVLVRTPEEVADRLSIGDHFTKN